MNFGSGQELHDPDAHFRQGVFLAKQGRWKEALTSYQESLRINPGRAETYLNIGFVYYELGYDNEAERAFDKASELQARPSIR
jgi:tetratricopeptide (TPR) repeat protein